MGRRNPTWSGKGVSKKEDIWFSKSIRERDGWRCQKCFIHNEQTTVLMDCAHIEKRTHKRTRWDPENCITLCRKCHNHFETHPTEFTYWLETILGRPHLEELMRRRNQVFKAPDDVRQAISDHYRNEFNRMRKGGVSDLRPYPGLTGD